MLGSTGGEQGQHGGSSVSPCPVGLVAAAVQEGMGDGKAAVLARNVPEAWAGLSTAPGLCLHTPGAARGKPLTSRTQDGAPLLPCLGRAEGAAPGGS